MSIIIEEIKKGNGRYFKKSILDEDKNLIQTTIVQIYIKKVRINNFDYLMLFTGDMELIDMAYYYLNQKKRNQSFNTRYIIASALKQLYEFSYLIETNVEEMDLNDLIQFQYFLKGYNDGLQDEALYFYKVKSKSSIRKYIGICKEYLKSNHLNNYTCLDISINQVSTKKSNKILDCPSFISYEEMDDILNFIQDDESLSLIEKYKYIAIYSLMEYAGLRIGEVLGLTIQDFSIEENSAGDRFYVIKIRNRVSDNVKQLAKTCMNVTNVKQYQSSEYLTKNIGWQEQVIPEEVYLSVMDYFDMATEFFDNLNMSLAPADDVENKGPNVYIFNNKNKNTPMNIGILSAYTVKLFRQLNIPTDKGKRYKNLFHRFRHGYIMHLLYDLEISPAMAIKYSRHSSTRSLEPYNNPTKEQLSKFLEELE